MARLNGQSIFLNALNGLTSNFTYLMTGAKGKGLTLENITNPSDDINKNGLNHTFTNFLATNFGKLDKDADGEVTSSELQNYTNGMLRSGMTYNQICELSVQGGTNTLLETVLTNFSEIDKNGDGKVTSQEIAGYGIDQEIDEMKDKYPRHNISAMSIFYDTASSSSDSEDKKV